MKKKLLFLFSLISVLFLVACGNLSGESANTEMGELQWPEHQLVSLIPMPKSNIGEVKWEYSDEISICIGNTTKEDYNAYKQACAEAGFKTVTSEGGTFYYVNNADGYRLSLLHNEDNEMTITIKEPLFVVQLEIGCSPNLLLNKYNLKLYVDLTEIGTLEHGKSNVFETELEKGKHTLRIERDDDDSVKGEIEFSVPENLQFKYEVSCESDHVEINHIAEVEFPFASGDLVGKNYSEVKSLISDAGFDSISENEIKDLASEELDKQGIVTAITINGKSDFTSGEKLFPNTEIALEYHSALEICPPYNTDTAKGVDYLEVVKAFEEAGFTNIETVERNEASFWGYEDGTVANIYINGNGANIDGAYALDAEVRIDYYVISDSSNLKSDTELTSFYAQKAFEEYGERSYPYGFECHWFLDLINEEQLSDGTWFFKVGVTITNAYGAEYDTIAEGIVGGSDAYPKVVQFHVNN